MRNNCVMYMALCGALGLGTGCVTLRMMRMSDYTSAQAGQYSNCKAATITRVDGTSLMVTQPVIAMSTPADQNASIRGTQAGGIGPATVQFTEIDQVAFRCPDKTKTMLLGGGVAGAALLAILLTSGGDGGSGDYSIP